jgi:hypothetical protein
MTPAGWHTVDPGTSSGGPGKIGHTVGQLGDGTTDGEPAILIVGAWPNITYLPLKWNAANSRWVSEEFVLITQQDTWAMDLTNRTQAQLENWSEVTSAVPFGKSYALIDGPLDLGAAAFAGGTGVITVNDTSSPHSFPFGNQGGSGAPFLQIRDNFISYTGKTGTTFTGCKLEQGSGGVIPDNEYAVQGYPGGYGLVVDSLNNVDLLYAAGMHIQERLNSLMNSGPGANKLTIAPYWYQYNPGDATIPPTMPPSGGIGVSAGLQSTAGEALGWTQERPFFLTFNEFSDWPLAAPTKRFLVPKLVGKMQAGAVSSGEILDTTLVVRWVS